MSVVGFGAGTVSGGTGSSITQWRLLGRTADRQKTMMMSDPVNKADTQYARAKLASVGTVDELMSDRRLYSYVMRAFGLEDQINSQALVRKILTSDLSDPSSPANRIADPRFRELAAAFNFGASGSSGSSAARAKASPSFANQIADLYVTARFEETVTEKNEALGMMLDFTRKFPSKTSWADIMADDGMAAVVRTVYSMPEPIGPVDAAAQAKSLEAAVPFANMKVASVQADFREAFFNIWDASGNPRGSAVSSKLQWEILSSTYDRDKAAFAARYDVKRDVATLAKTIPTLDSVDDLLNDRKLLPIVLKAFDLEDKATDRTYLRKVLESDPNSATSFAVKAGPEEKALALAFGMTNSGAKRRGSPAFVEDIVNRYTTQSFEVSAGNANEALRLGLYFQRKAGGLTSWYQVLADQALAKVARLALNLPSQSAQIDLDRQVDMLSSKFDIKKLKDPAEVGKLIEKFLLMWDVTGEDNGNSASSSPLVQLLSGNGGRTSLDPSTLLAAASLRRRW
ncbi:DUF1217 domain-containing protein [Rhodocista pekingensis]|uniref:DUF1217 domain-containing protein n=1 Tax=Rhodocista pekingensis TaxID=201185 RepID=A0ABW2KYT6_9PROT